MMAVLSLTELIHSLFQTTEKSLSHVTLCDSMDCSQPGSSILGNSPSENTGMGCHALLPGIFPTQGLNPGLLHCRQILYCLNCQGSPRWL